MQGLAGPFFTRLGDHLRALGHEVHRVNFNAGDAAHWAGRPASNFRGSVDELPGWLASKLRELGSTDVMLFGCHRPVHLASITAARTHGACIHAFEEGYIRPNWITVERIGAQVPVALPRDPHWYREVDRLLPRHDDDQAIRVPLALRARQEVAYHLCNAVNPIFFPGYRSHRPRAALLEFAGFVRRYAAMPVDTSADAGLISDLLTRGRRYFLLPLQLNGDAQIVHHSPFLNIAEVIDVVLRSFAAHAASHTHLVVKNHPLDPGLGGHGREVRHRAEALGIGRRVHYIETGHLPTLLDHASGTVVVNSTVGMSALSQGCPTKALARPIYDMAGLTSRVSLNDFWRDPEPPDPALYRAVRNTVIHATQVNGDFCTRRGIALAIAGCGRMLEELSPLEQLLKRHWAQSAVDSGNIGWQPECRVMSPAGSGV
ncbi:MAG: capsular biosynthesis protein [Rhizobacter sp.]|nr:capsular biosynthesis protein [Rhizobacter sp.]